MILIISIHAAQPVVADSPRTAVLYPEIREPFRSVFTTIADGVSEALDGRVVMRSVRNEDGVDDLARWLLENGVTATVILGSRSPSLSDELPDATPVIIGGVHMSKELQGGAYYGISLNPDPTAMFRRLKSLAPGVNQIHIIYQKDRDQWMIDRAMAPASDLGIKLNPIPVDGLQDAANRYLALMRAQKSNTEALWLSQDSSILDEQAVLPMILKEAWDRKLIVFSSNPSHVRRGVLFALYPDNHGMGRSLGKMALKLHEHRTHNGSPYTGGLQPLNDLLTAFNVRTAGRLGVRYTRDDLSHFDLIFPPQ